MTFTWRDLLIISLIVLVLGLILASYGIFTRNECIIISSSILILFPIPFIMLARKGLGGETENIDLYENAIIALITISIVSLSGYFLFATIPGKAVSLAIFLGTTVSLVVEYVNRIREKRKHGVSGETQQTTVKESLEGEGNVQTGEEAK